MPFQNFAQWILGQAGYVILAIVVIVSLVGFIQRRITMVVSTIIVGAVLEIFAFGGTAPLQALAHMFQSALGL